MLVQRDVSELTENQKGDLVISYLDRLAWHYRAESERVTKESGPLAQDIASAFASNENEILRLKSWVNIIIQQHFAAKMVNALNRSVSPGPPQQMPPILEGYIKAYGDAVAALAVLELRLLPYSNETGLPGLRSTVVTAALALLRGMEKNVPLR